MKLLRKRINKETTKRLIGLFSFFALAVYSLMCIISQSINIKYWFSQPQSETEMMYLSVYRDMVFFCWITFFMSFIWTIIFFTELLKKDDTR